MPGVTAMSSLLAIFGLCCGLGTAQQPKDFLKARDKLCCRTNGVLLQVGAQGIRSAEDKLLVKIDWSVNYDGPRQRLIMLKPLILLPNSGQTIMWCYIETGDGKLCQCALGGAILPSAPPVSPEEWFVKVEKGQLGTGTTSVSVANVRAAFAAQCKEKVGAFPKLHVQIQHCPFERGEHYHLDAWTGELWSNVFPVPLPDNWWYVE
jgi:hypothetical protein